MNTSVFKKSIASGLFVGSLLLSMPLAASAAATLFLTPATGAYKSGELFSVLVDVNTGDDTINASSAQISFDNTHLEVVSVGYSQSIFSLWTEKPSFSNPGGFIKFSGGLPNPGYTGAKGDVLRITFRTKASGQTPLTFVSGSVLANDGKGSNIADALKGALFTISPPSPSITPFPSKTIESDTGLVDSQAVTSIPVPIITQWPKQIVSGETITIEGLGHPLDKIVLIVQKDSELSDTGYTYPAPDGKFIYTYPKPLRKGIYQIWARNVTGTGVESGLSNPAQVEVISPASVTIGNFEFSYLSIIAILASLIVIAGILFSWIWLGYRKWRGKQMIEIREVEHAVHQSFDMLREGLEKYVAYLVEAKTASGLKKREQQTKKELKDQLDQIEDTIAKEIDDIKK